MNESIAILGRQPSLGLAELESLYGAQNLESLGSGAARLHIDSCNVDFSRLGGTIKLCKLLTVVQTTDWSRIQKFLVDAAPEQAARMPEGKMHLGLSAYDIPVSPQQLTATGLTIKKAIQKKTGRTVRLVPNKEAQLNAAQVIHNKLLSTNGWELVCIRHGSDTFIAQTVRIQDIDDYTLRDRGRPRRDARVGMLPPKLAQIIINTAVGSHEYADLESKPSDNACIPHEQNDSVLKARGRTIVLDPFCGTGVILQEASLMGYQTYGTDVEQRMVGASQANLQWLAETYHRKLPRSQFAVGDATSYTWQKPDVIACETYLGRPFTSLPSTEVLHQTASSCNLIIKKFLQHIHRQLAPGTRLCLAVPAWQKRPGTGDFLHLPLIDQLREMGYNRVSFKHVRDSDLLYYRTDQYVARQLLIITRI